MVARVVDLFAGWGGASSGAAAAGATVVLAANHWRVAVDAHALNHPNTLHLCQDLNQANFWEFPDHEVLWASPACQGFSQAAQGARKHRLNMRCKHDAIRSTAWAVINCVEAKRPEVVFVENVLDFLRWELYPMWKACLDRMGYAVEEHVADATAFGVPQRRRRLVIVATRSRAPLGLKLPVVPRSEEPAFGPCIDWDDRFVDPGETGWEKISNKTTKVQERIHRARTVKGRGERFLTQYVTNHPGVPLEEAIRTITTKSQWAIVDGDRIRMLRVREIARGMGFEDDYGWPEGSTKGDQIKGLGNAVAPPVAEWFVEQALAVA